MNNSANDWKKQYTPEQLEVIRTNWRDRPPTECQGKCQITDGFLIAGCKNCEWSEEMPSDIKDY